MDKTDRLWLKWMKIGEKTGCHQRADRSLFFKGYQLPVCARCCGVILGYMIAVPSFFLFGFLMIPSFVGSSAMLIDWLLQAVNIKKSNNVRRIITGIIGGFGILSIQLFVIQKIFKMVRMKLS